MHLSVLWFCWLNFPPVCGCLSCVGFTAPEAACLVVSHRVYWYCHPCVCLKACGKPTRIGSLSRVLNSGPPKCPSCSVWPSRCRFPPEVPALDGVRCLREGVIMMQEDINLTDDGRYGNIWKMKIKLTL
jgi:hypothetical protein